MTAKKKRHEASISGNFWGLTGEHNVVVQKSGVLIKFRSAWVSAVSSWGLRDLRCLHAPVFPHPLVRAWASLYLSKFNSSQFGLTSSSLWLHLQFCGPSLSASTSFFSLLSPVMFVFQVRLTALGAPPPPPPHFSPVSRCSWHCDRSCSAPSWVHSAD